MIGSLPLDEQLHQFALFPKVFFQALAKGEGTISKFFNAMLDNQKIKLDDNNCPGYFNAEDVFILSLYCEDAQNLSDNLNIIMKCIKKEQRTFDCLLSTLTKLYENDINNCKSFLTIEKTNDIINSCSEFIEEKKE